MSAKRYQPVRRIKRVNAEGVLVEQFDLGRSLPIALFRACHPSRAALVALGVTVAAALAGRSTREVGLVLLTVLVGQFILGLQNDLVDRTRDRTHGREGKPLAEGYLDPGTAAFAIAVAVLLVVPLSIANGRIAGGIHLAILAVAMIGNAGLFRRGKLSFLTWALTFGGFAGFLSYGGWGGEGDGGAPTIAIVACGALIGIGLHVLASLPGLVDDNADGWRTLPLALALRTGAPKLLALTVGYLVIVLVATVLVGVNFGLIAD
ncbi:hypothetical protein ACLM5J_00750 [Nocardioides sp. Bht2]|uniref:hypothetical protein n=1 Tax=Nocardioides sp. Bht2 TaxID=3392297 RepID=UPI0039B61142